MKLKTISLIQTRKCTALVSVFDACSMFIVSDLPLFSFNARSVAAKNSRFPDLARSRSPTSVNTFHCLVLDVD